MIAERVVDSSEFAGNTSKLKIIEENRIESASLVDDSLDESPLPLNWYSGEFEEDTLRVYNHLGIPSVLKVLGRLEYISGNGQKQVEFYVSGESKYGTQNNSKWSNGSESVIKGYYKEYIDFAELFIVAPEIREEPTS